MEKLRFKVWDEESQTMRKVLQVNWKEDDEDGLDAVAFRDASGKLKFLSYASGPFVLCQHTELEDDDGEEMYTWDVVELHIPHETKEPYYSLIYSTAKGYMVEPPPGHRGFDPSLRDLHYYTTEAGRCKNIGNIHTHYDLVRDVVEEKVGQDERNRGDDLQ